MTSDYTQATGERHDNQPSINSEQKVPPGGSSRLLAQAIVLSTLIAAGVATFAIVVFGNIHWYLPALAYGLVVYFAFAKFLRPDA